MSLTEAEKYELASRISKGTKVLCSGIAHMYLTSPNPKMDPRNDSSGVVAALRKLKKGKWKDSMLEGALLLVRKKSGCVFLKLYDLALFDVKFQYELYENLEYLMLNDNFHAFEMEDYVSGFAFSDAKIAQKFYMKVQQYIPRPVFDAPVAQHEKSAGFSNMPRPMGDAAPSHPVGKAKSVKSTRSGRGFSLKKAFNRTLRRNKSKKTDTTSTMATNNQNHPQIPQQTPQVAPKPVGFGNPNRATLRIGTAKKQMPDLYTSQGLLDPDNVPKEWQYILRGAGIRKKDLRDPNMFEIIQDVLQQHDISVAPPDVEDVADLEGVYNETQMEQYRQYQQEMDKYHEDQKRYEREMMEFRKAQEQERKLQELMAKQKELEAQLQARERSEENLKRELARQRQSPMRPQAPAVNTSKRNLPRVSMARPALPALPPVPQRRPQMTKGKSSRAVFNAAFLGDIKNKDFQLKPVLPTMKNVEKSKATGIMEALRQRVLQQREAVNGTANENAEESDDSDFSDFEGGDDL